MALFPYLTNNCWLVAGVISGHDLGSRLSGPQVLRVRVNV